MAREMTIDVPFELWGALDEALDRFDATEDHPDPAVRAALLVDALKVVKAARACLESHDQAMCRPAISAHGNDCASWTGGECDCARGNPQATREPA